MDEGVQISQGNIIPNVQDLADLHKWSLIIFSKKSDFYFLPSMEHFKFKAGYFLTTQKY